MAKNKRIRLLTKRYTAEEGNDTAFEYIEMEEIDGKQYLYQRMGEKRIDGECHVIAAEGCFPISMDLVQERFKELGRSYVPTRKEVAKTVQDLMVKEKL